MSKYEKLPLTNGTAHIKVCGDCGAVVFNGHTTTHDVFHAVLKVLVDEHLERTGANATPLDGPLDQRWTQAPAEIKTRQEPA